MRTKQVVDRQKEAQAVVAAGRTHQGELAARISERLTPVLKRGEKLPDFALVVELLSRDLEQATTELVKADDSYQRELSDDEAPRRERDAALAALADALVELREVLTGIYGAAVLKDAGFSQVTPRDPVLLVRFAGQVQRGLSEISLPAPRIKGAQLDVKATVADLGQRCVRLNSAVAAVTRETREAQAALSLRNEAQEHFDRGYTEVSTVLAGLLRLAGQADLADRLRPSSIRRAEEPEQPIPTPGPVAPEAPKG